MEAQFQLEAQQLRSSKRGFSLIELMIVMSVAIIVTAMAVPVFRSAMTQYQLRTTTVEIATLLQRSRMQCIQTNRALPVIAAGGSNRIFLDQDLSGTYNDVAGNREPMVLLPNNTVFLNAAPTAIPQATLGFVGQNFPAQFDNRGLPCIVNGGVCRNFVVGGANAGAPVGYLVYLRQTVGAAFNYAAVSVTPAGQVKTWAFNGTTWANK